MEQLSGSSLIDAMEEWLSSEDFDRSWKECYERSCKGATGRSDRNISESVLFQTASLVHSHLPFGVLESMIPQPDKEFVQGSLEAVGAEDSRKAGFKDLEHFEAALVVVYTHLAHCADMLEQEMPGMADAVASGKIDPRA
ncbi:unnamed protein product [Polarella glacialis]|uniref:Uncharacterized protein n=1 Tax=Polarella glacialis TaxID=89957 RepID=A0A813HSK4_POLGL|nr:unnamed protein product [Polarella glacialis]CAE8641138.1 unnamed protein product [Polarella glacialis]|mmetsp:Transcript_21938/g.35183  ORF Transcript_21938/g.35183 Transcript_21938/m.35183 type:complete len:140 (+) Transcript_21938:60-479(+)